MDRFLALPEGAGDFKAASGDQVTAPVIYLLGWPGVGKLPVANELARGTPFWLVLPTCDTPSFTLNPSGQPDSGRARRGSVEA